MKRLRWPAAILLLAAAPARAQEVPARLTLDDALRIARTHNATYLQAVNGLVSAAAEERQAWGQFLPNVSTSLRFSGTHSRSLTGTGDFGEVVVNPEYVETTSSNASQGISLDLTLFDGVANLNTLRSARAGMRAAAASRSAAELRLRQEVATAYYAVLRADRTLRVEEALLASAREQLEMTERRFQIGSANREDVLGAQAEVANRRQTLLQAQGEAEKARLELFRVLGVRGEAVEPVDDAPAVFDPGLLDVDALVASALASNPRVLQREAEVRRAELDASAARGRRWPTVSAGLSYGRGVGRRDYEALFEFDPPNSSWGFDLSVSLPIFNRFQTSTRIAQAEVQAENARHAAAAERLAVETEVRQALVDLRNAYRGVQLAEQALALSQERLRLTQERYRAGTSVGFIQFQSAIDGAASAERGAINARFNFVTALVNLETKVGREVRP